MLSSQSVIDDCKPAHFLQTAYHTLTNLSLVSYTTLRSYQSLKENSVNAAELPFNTLRNFVCRNASFHQGTCYQVQYCAKVMQVKCANFVLCSRDFSMKVRLKVCMKFHAILSDNSLEQRAIFLRSFIPPKKIREHKR